MSKRTDISKIPILGSEPIVIRQSAEFQAVSRQHSLRAAFIGLLLFFVLSLWALACSYFPPTYTVGKNFAVRVSSLEGATFPGVRVILVREHRVSKFALTDEKGRVHFENVEPGDYSLEIDQLGIAGWDTAGLNVVDSPDKHVSNKQEIQLHWPSSQDLQTTDV